MIYEVYIQRQLNGETTNELLYYPNDESFSLLNSKLETALNEAGSFECDVPKSNLRYADIDESCLRSAMIQVLKDGIEIFYGEIREVTQNFDFTKHLYVVGELAFLFDSIQPQHKYQDTPTNMFYALIANHNSQVEDRKKFIARNVLVEDPNDYIYHFTNREDTLSALREKMCDTLNGFLRISKSNGQRYLDLIPLSAYGEYCTQEIQFGENMLDYSANYSANDIATCVIPLGVRLDDNQRTSDAIDGLDEYLTIKGTEVDENHAHESDDFVYIQSAVNKFGWVRVVKSWDDVTLPGNLKSKAVQWLTDAQYSKMELELNAVDLSMLDHNIDSFEVGDTVHCWAEPYNMDTTFPVRKKTIYLNDLSKNFITLSNTEVQKSYTSQQSQAVNSIKDEIPETFTILQESKIKALEMLLDETQGGNVVYEYHYNSDGKAESIEAINICDEKTIEASSKRWRWSQNGLGYMYRSDITQEWQGPLVAMTADGAINADRITTGTLNANKVKVNGKIEATSGFIGTSNNNGWNIGSADIHKGVTGIDDILHNGTYVGTDGIRNQKNGEWTRISGGVIATNGVIAAGSFVCNASGGNITSGDNGHVYSGKAYQTKANDGNTYSGYTGTVTLVVEGKGISIRTINGIVVAMAQV